MTRRLIAPLGAGLLVGCLDVSELRFDCPDPCEASGGGGSTGTNVGGAGGSGAGAGPGTGASGGGGQGGGPTYSDVVMEDQPLGYWRLSVDDGATTPDESGSGYDATLIDNGGNASFDFGVAGAIDDPDGAVRITGRGELHVEGDHPFEFDGNASYTLELWVKIEQSGAAFLSCRNVEPPPGPGYVNLATLGTFSHMRSDGGGGVEEMKIDPFSATEYQHLAVVFDHVTQEGQIYQNGELSFLPAEDLAVSWSANGLPLRLVTAVDMNTILELDEVAVYDKALPAQRIQLHHDCGVNRAACCVDGACD